MLAPRYKSNAGLAAKDDVRISALQFPKRSPDLNPLGYGFRAEVNRRMRAAEKDFRPSFRQDRAAYAARLRRTAMAVPEAKLRALIGSMTRRCRAVVAANGGHINID